MLPQSCSASQQTFIDNPPWKTDEASGIQDPEADFALQ
jgi:hypothetical protein